MTSGNKGWKSTHENFSVKADEVFQFGDEFSETKLTRKALANYVKDKLQPRGNAYNGIGVAKPSVWVALESDDFRAAFEEVGRPHCSNSSRSHHLSLPQVYDEHIHGWAGKAYNKVRVASRAPRVLDSSRERTRTVNVR